MAETIRKRSSYPSYLSYCLSLASPSYHCFCESSQEKVATLLGDLFNLGLYVQSCLHFYTRAVHDSPLRNVSCPRPVGQRQEYLSYTSSRVRLFKCAKLAYIVDLQVDPRNSPILSIAMPLSSLHNEHLATTPSPSAKERRYREPHQSFLRLPVMRHALGGSMHELIFIILLMR